VQGRRENKRSHEKKRAGQRISHREEKIGENRARIGGASMGEKKAREKRVAETRGENKSSVAGGKRRGEEGKKKGVVSSINRRRTRRSTVQGKSWNGRAHDLFCSWEGRPGRGGKGKCSR